MLETLETPVHSTEKKAVLKAISQAAGKITVADIATKTALPVLKAGSLLNQIAYETGGHLTVGTAGNIVYQFDPNFENSYLTRDSKKFLLRAWRVIFNGAAYLFRLFSLAMFFVIRVSFGIILVLSVVLVVVLVIVAVVALLARLMGDNDNDSGPNFDLSGLFNGIGGTCRYWAFDWLWDWWYWGSYLRPNPYPNYTPTYSPSTGSKPATSKGQKDKESFLDKCFSFLFGDGDPNQGLSERYWQTIANILKANGGVIVAEQLAPYALSEGKNEDWVLPILVRFNGNCDVSDNGNIIYSFPSFQQKKSLSGPAQSTFDSSPGAASSTQPEELHQLFRKHVEHQMSSHERQDAQSHLEMYLRERPWELTHVSSGTRTTIICFAIFVSIGSVWLTQMTSVLPLLAMLKPVLWAMAVYGSMFLIIPAIRSMLINKRNEGITARNSIRFTAANKLQSAADELRKKLDEADHARHVAMEKANTEEVAYSTDKDLLEQEFDNKNVGTTHASDYTISLKPNSDEPSKNPETPEDKGETISLKNKESHKKPE